jgi:peptidoglycan glycosyltransferase
MRQRQGSEDFMKRPVRKVAIACMILFAALLVNANWVQVGQAGKLGRNPANEERRVAKELERERGSIFVGDQKAASSLKPPGGDTYLRGYPTGKLFSDVVGYWGGSSVSSVGLELAEDRFLSGEDDRLLASRVTGLVSGEKIRGGSVRTTLVPEVQRAAADALGRLGARGSVVALDPRSGAVLAMVTSPTYDPNPLASRTGSVALDAFTALKNDPSQPLLNRAAQETYPPGSTWKVVTAAASLSAGVVNDVEDRVFAPRELDLPQTSATLPNFRDENCELVNGNPEETTLLLALQTSCNTAFGALGLKLGDDRLRDQAERFGVNDTVKGFPLPQARSVFPRDLDGAQTAQSAVGQRDVRVTPLQMAQIAAAVANRGVRMRPYLVESYLGPDGDQIDRAEPTALDEATPPDVANKVAVMMKSVVDQGTGTAAQIPGVGVAGKTGTAEFGDPVQGAHAWFIGFAPFGNPSVAVAVVVEEGGPARGTGGKVAAPLAKEVIQAALGARR